MKAVQFESLVEIAHTAKTDECFLSDLVAVIDQEFDISWSKKLQCCLVQASDLQLAVSNRFQSYADELLSEELSQDISAEESERRMASLKRFTELLQKIDSQTLIDVVM